MDEVRQEFMRRAIALSAERMRAGLGGPFGALVVRDGAVIAEGFNQVTTANDPTAHAEVSAIREACRVVGDFSLAGCEIYTSCEPCPMCLSAIYWARIERIYYANTRHDAAAIGFDDVPRARTWDPPLTTIRQPLVDKGRAAAELLLEQINGGPPRRTILPIELVVRASTAPPLARGD